MFVNWLDRRSSGSVLYRFSSIYFNLIYALIHSASVTLPAALSPRPFSRHDLLKASTPSLSLCPFVPYCPPSQSQRHHSPAAATLLLPPSPSSGFRRPPPFGTARMPCHSSLSARFSRGDAALTVHCPSLGSALGWRRVPSARQGCFEVIVSVDLPFSSLVFPCFLVCPCSSPSL